MTHANGRDSECRVELDQVFKALSDPIRRRILVSIMEDNPRREQEFESLEFRPATADREVVSIKLHHTHLPRLDDAGFIDWDRQTGTITKGKRFGEIRPLLRLMDDHEDELPGDWP